MHSATTQIIISAKDHATSTFRKMSVELQSFKQHVFSIQTAFVGLAGSMAARQLVDSAIKWQGIERGIAAAAGTATRGAEEMKFLEAESERLGLRLSTTADAYKNILAASQNTALAGQGVRDVFTAVAEASTVMGMSADETGGILRALDQMLGKGKVSAEELRGQLGERLPGAFRIAADAMGVTTAQLDQMLAQGKIVAEDFLPKFAKALKARYSGSVDEASHSIQANLNRLSNTWEQVTKRMASGRFLDVLNDSLMGLGDYLDQNEDLIVGTFESLVDAGGKLATDVAPAVNTLAQAMGGVVTTFNAMPDYVKGPTGDGIIARWFFGSWKVGALVAAISTVNELVKGTDALLGTSNSLGSIGDGKDKYLQSYQNLMDVFMGRRHADTGQWLEQGHGSFRAAIDRSRTLADEMARQEMAINAQIYGNRSPGLGVADPLYGVPGLGSGGKAAKEAKGRWMSEMDVLRKGWTIDPLKRQSMIDQAFSGYLTGMESSASTWKDRIKTPMDEYKAALLELDQLKAGGWITDQQWTEGLALAADSLDYTTDAVERQVTALERYADTAGFTADNIENAMLGSLRSVEDAFVSLATTGKFSFEGLVDSILADLTRLTVQQAITGPMSKAMSGLPAFLSTVLSSAFGGGKASGGPLEQGRWYVAVERGPEPIWGGGPGAFAAGYGKPSTGTSAPSAMTIKVVNETGQPVQGKVRNVYKKDHQIVAELVMQNIAANGPLRAVMANR